MGSSGLFRNADSSFIESISWLNLLYNFIISEDSILLLFTKAVTDFSCILTVSMLASIISFNSSLLSRRGKALAKSLM